MAILKRSLRRKNASGTYDSIRLESDSSIVYRPSGRTVEQDLEAYLPTTQSSDVVPKTLGHGKIMMGTNKAWIGNGSNKPVDLLSTTTEIFKIQSTLPGEVDKNKLWIDTTNSTYPVLRFWNPSNSTWDYIAAIYSGGRIG